MQDEEPGRTIRGEITRASTRKDKAARAATAVNAANQEITVRAAQAAVSGSGSSFRDILPTEAEREAAISSYRLWGMAPASGANVEPFPTPTMPTMFEDVPVLGFLESTRNDLLLAPYSAASDFEQANAHTLRARHMSRQGADDAAVDELLQGAEAGAWGGAKYAAMLAVPEEGAAAAAARQGAANLPEVAASRARWPSYTIGETRGGAAGTTDKYGNITINPELEADEILATLKHEEVHSKLSPVEGTLFAEARADLGMWAYRRSHLAKFIEEVWAETAGTGSFKSGVAEAFRPEYAISKAQLSFEALLYTGVVFGPSAFFAFRE